MIEAFGAIYDRAGVARPPEPIHCPRHTFGTVMARRVPLPVLQKKLMGHADISPAPWQPRGLPEGRDVSERRLNVGDPIGT